MAFTPRLTTHPIHSPTFYISCMGMCYRFTVVFIRISTLSENGLLEKMKICGEETGRKRNFNFSTSPGRCVHKWLENGSDIRRGSIIAFCWCGFVEMFCHWLHERVVRTQKTNFLRNPSTKSFCESFFQKYFFKFFQDHKKDLK